MKTVKSGEKSTASIKDVAEKAGVSTATVSHVINQTRFVAEETKLKVMQTMKELDYRPNSIARSLRSAKSKTIGLLIPVTGSDTSNFFFMSIAQGIESKLKEHGYNLILSNSNEDIENEQEQIKSFNSQLIDGLIIAPTGLDSSYLEKTLSGTYPVVFIDRKPRGFNGDFVLVDNFRGTYDAVQLLVKKGHRYIGYLTGTLGLSSVDERLQGYKKALEKNNIPLNDKHIREGKPSFDSGYQLTKEIMEEEKITALIVSNNVMTMGAMAFLQEKQMKIPDQLAVIGYDDYDWAKITTPPLTVIKQPAFDLGVTAGETLIERINNPEKVYSEVTLVTDMIIRQSV
ncbi:LacI family DNA-binding transcriptional regulator [Metabacillus litoralis]|uniref:LacI family DNA-binding transcriptional regulator n=1 Tax=Metabacillus litoralis TaxID=152268 RepID=UPI001CFD2E4D|nr:LacI family DNA-binding transcriptional regulator [Metabacillus litoralis]